ncbi:MAG: hypothetical protein V4547_16805 [Bacteroidota bacterium]
MKQIINSSQAYDKANSILTDVLLQIKEHTQGELIPFEEQSFEDMSGNEICGIDDENVYMGFNLDPQLTETYPLHDLDLFDAIKILGDLEAGVYSSAGNTNIKQP